MCRSAIAAKTAWSAGASGVVSTLGWSTPSTRMPTVPINPTLRPAARRPASTRYVVVVLPDVPVTPMTRNFDDGSPYTKAAAAPSTERGAGGTTAGTLDGRVAAPAGSVSTATAPRATASAANWAPCTFVPCRAAKMSPGSASWARSVTPLTATAALVCWLFARALVAKATSAPMLSASCRTVTDTVTPYLPAPSGLQGQARPGIG